MHCELSRAKKNKKKNINRTFVIKKKWSNDDECNLNIYINSKN